MKPNSWGSIDLLVSCIVVLTDSYIVQCPKSISVVLNCRSEFVTMACTTNGTGRV